MSIKVDIKKSFGTFTLESSFESEGGVTGLLGASGCGKTMTLQCIAGVQKPDSGLIVINDHVLFDSKKKINLIPQERRVGYLFQNYALFPNMTVEQNIECSLIGNARVNRTKISREEKKEKIRSIMERMHITGLEKRKPSQLSGGQQQRVALGRILIGSPDIILMDEPMNALDTFLKAKLRQELVEILSDFNKDAIIVTHDRDEAYEMCRHIAIMDNGHIISYGKTKEIFDSPGCRAAAVLTGCKNITDAQKVSEHEAFIPSWGITLKTAESLRDDLTGIGIRAHYFFENETENSYPVNITEVTEQPFEWTIKFRYPYQDQASSDIWWRIPKSGRTEPKAEKLGVPPECVLPLY